MCCMPVAYKVVIDCQWLLCFGWKGVAVLRAMAVNLKWPPHFESEDSYVIWREDVELWSRISKIPKNEQAACIRLSLKGRAKVASSEIGLDVLMADDGVTKLLEKLDGLFLVDKGRRQFMAFEKLHNLRRKEGGDVRQFISDFDHCCFEYEKLDMALAPTVKAFLLLSSCNFEKSDQKLVMSAITEVTYEVMVKTVTRIFSGGMGGPSGAGQDIGGSIKIEPVMVGEREDVNVGDGAGALLAGSFRRGRPRVRGGQYYGTRVNSRSAGTGSSGKWRKQNPVGQDGQVTRCAICDSRFHWARECPDAYENRNVNGKTGMDNKGDSSRVKGDDTEGTFLSLFLGYAGAMDKGGKIQRLVEESSGCVVLDSGCSSTVCGAGWYDTFVKGLSEYEKEKIVMEKSTANFTFADGVTVPSVMKVKLPCMIGGMRAEIATDVVECNIPLLLSRYSMKRAKMIMNFVTDQVKVMGRVVDLLTSTSGHYLMPISA